MIGNQIFFGKFVGIEKTDIVNEIIAYVEGQYKSGILSPEFYDDTLMFASEILPYTKNQNTWIDLGYRLCRYLKQNLERHGFCHKTHVAFATVAEESPQMTTVPSLQIPTKISD